jgi:hypothetical protein
MFRALYRYRGSFEDAKIGSLLEYVEVSQMRPRAVRLRGEILGRGAPCGVPIWYPVTPIAPTPAGCSWSSRQ